MVFESIVADLLNRFLGDFVDNLDSSQLNIGIWGGDVKLENLEVKETALDDLDLPVKLKYGYLSSLILKIPWKNLYNEPVIATIDGLNLIVVPNKGVVYNEDKAKKNAEDIKQKTLSRLEEARKNRRKPADPAQDSFAEKMITQIIKNLQVSVSNIHVRFEDKYTNRNRPFVAGITLQKLEFQTTDEQWKPTIHKEVVKVIHKLVSLHNLAVYWNSGSELISDLNDKKVIRQRLQESIHAGKTAPPGYKYILEPISMNAKLKLNQKPETDGSHWTIPKIDLAVDMKTLALAIGKFQYQDILLFLEAQERFQLAGQYLKYRPDLNIYKGHYKQWWKFAYTSILEEKVRRRRNNWSWTRMRNHRRLVREYKEAWVRHQTEKSPPSTVTDTIKRAEVMLDVFNVNVARQQAEMEMDRRGLTRLEDQAQGWVAWGKSWFGGGPAQPSQGKKSAKDYAAQFQEAMTPEEKAKLFDAIDYQENFPPTNYPKEFVQNKFEFQLGQVAIVVDGAVSMQLLHLKANVEQRPSANALNLRTSIQELRMDGCGAEMLRVRDTTQNWLDVVVDTNPLHGSYDQKIQLSIAPVVIKYHAPAINNAIDVFKPPESVKLNQLTAVAMSRYEEVKARSVTGLAHAVEHRSKLILDIKIQPATLYISEGGIYCASKPTILADLGLLSITTIDTISQSAMQDKKLALMEKAYDRFRVKLSNVVIAMAEDVPTVQSSIGESSSHLHILRPTGLDIQIHKSSIDDLQLAKLRIIGDLPDIVIGISDKRLMMLMKLLLTIPKPPADQEVVVVEDAPDKNLKLKDRAKMRTIMEVEEVETREEAEQKKEEEKSKTSEQQVQIELDLNLNQIGLVLCRGDDVLCDISILRMGCKLQMRTFDMVITAALGSVRVNLPTFTSLDSKRQSLYLIDNDEEEGSLMTLKFVQANPESPFFDTQYHRTEQAIDFVFTRLNVSLHQQGLMELKKFGEKLQKELTKLQEETKTDIDEAVEVNARKISRKLSESMDSLASYVKGSQSSAATEKKRKLKDRRDRKAEKEADNRIIKMKVVASIGSLAVLMGTQKGLETVLAIEKVQADVKMTLKTMEVTTTLQAIKMEDMVEGALYRKLLSVTGDKEMLRFEMIQYQRTEKEKKAMKADDLDMKVKVRLAQMRFVFLNLWLCRLMAWLAPFQAEAARAAQAAQEVAAERAAEAAQNVKQILEQSPPKMQLDVELNAPIIIVPRLSTSHDVIVFIMGTVTVNNKVGGDARYQKAILDVMNVKLTDMTFAIGRMNAAASEIDTKSDIMKPLTFGIQLQRNLTFGSIKDVPEIVVDAEIPSIEVNLSEEDYKTLMQTLSGNLTEGKDLGPPPALENNQSISTMDDTDESGRMKEPSKSQPSPDKKKSLYREADAGSPHASGDGLSSSPAVATQDKIYTRIVFKFNLSKIHAILYTGSGADGTRLASSAFAAMRIDGLKLNGRIKEDNALEVAIALHSFTMTDERKEKTKINQLMDKKTGHDGEELVALQYAQDAAQDKIVKLKMCPFYICLCPEFLGCLSRFFAVPKSEEEIEKEVTTGGKSSVNTAAIATTAANVEPPKPANILLDCDMKGVEVLLVENSMEPETTQALILSFNIKMAAHPHDTYQTIKGGIDDLKVFSSYYALKKRHEVDYEVLKSMSIGVDIRMEKDTKAQDVVLRMSPMELRMSPSIIRLLSSVNTEFSKSSAVDATVSLTIPKRKTYPDYWGKKAIEFRNYWFFNETTEAEEAFEDSVEDEEEAPPPTILAPIEKLTMEIKRISFTLEAGTGTIPVPLIFLDMLVSAEASGWSSGLRATADVSLQMSYYNEAFSVWEPVIEPVEVGTERFERWNLKMNVKGRNKLDPRDQSAAMDVKIDADKMLNITVTKSFLNLLNKLSEVFAQAAKQITPPISRALPGTSPFVILNETGMLVKVRNSESIKVSDNDIPIDTTHGAFVDLNLSQAKLANLDTTDERLNHNQVELSALLQLELLDTIREVKIGRAEKRSVPLPKKSDGGKQWKVIAETSIENGRRLVTLTSHIEVENHLEVDIEVYSKRDTSLDMCGVVPVGGKLPLPVPLLFTPTGELYFKPANEKYEVSFESLSWHTFEEKETKARKVMRCDMSDDTTQEFFFETVYTKEDVIEGIDGKSNCYTISLYPPMEFHNNLPFPITMELPVAVDFVPGEHRVLNVIPGHRLKIWVSQGSEMYSLDIKLQEEKKDLEVVTLHSETGGKDLLLGMHYTFDYGGLKAYLYAPFWLVNNTSKTIRHLECAESMMSKSTGGCVPCRKIPLDQSDLTRVHPSDDNPIILPFPSLDFAKKKKSRVSIESADDVVSAWSEEFPLDTVGNPARVTCKGSDRDYDITVDIQLCQSGLTKIVSFSPFYLVSNLSKFDMEVREEGQDLWTSIPPEKCIGIWPVQRSKKKLICARYSGQQDESLLFPITENLETLCQIAGGCVGIDVTVSTGESSVAIHLAAFQPGMAPCCILNTLKVPVTIGQKGHSKQKIDNGEMIYFTWSDVTSDRLMELEAGDYKTEDKLDQNRLIDIQLDKTKMRRVYMTNFLLGRQRTILLTDDLDIAKKSFGSWETDIVDMQCDINIQGIGISVVDNLAGKEILFMGISSSDILWEEEVKKGRFKPLTVKMMQSLEEKYQEHLITPNTQYQQIDQFEVNLANMIIKKKKNKEYKIRRSFGQGISLSYGKSAQRTRLHFKLNHLQVDNQLDACIFPRVLAVVPPPKSVVADNVPKPFIELSVLKRETEYSSVVEMEYCHVLVQEFAVQVDQGLINALIELVANHVQRKPYGKEMFDQDMALTAVRLEDTALQYKSQRPKSFYNDFHISPLMIHLSFSQGGTSGATQNGNMPIHSEFMNVLLKSVGVSLTELQDVVFKLAYFERKCVFYSPDQLNSEIVSHYVRQAIKQMYVLVLGLDIIGNPFGLVRDLSAGVEDLFYQPFQGAIQGPEEFATGVALGVSSMFGHAVGGAAGAVGRITGTVGKGVAALTFDADYQRKRQEDLNRRPQSFGEGMARGMKGLGMGVVDGITGIVTKPIEGAKSEGGFGFVKGVGKGLLGAVVRPVSGVVDFASSTMNSVKSVAGTGREAGALRPPRVIRADRLVRPYSQQEALGFKIFKDTDRGALAESDEYITYAPITEKIVLLITKNQLVLSKRTDVMGVWQSDWKTEYTKIQEPKIVPEGIKILFNEKKKGFFSSSSEGKIITFQNSQAIQQKVLMAYRAATSSKNV